MGRMDPPGTMFSLLAATLLPIVGAVAQRVYTLNIVNANVNPDGFVRSAVTVNGTFGGLLVANKREQFIVTVNNALGDSRMSRGTSIHWHGILQYKHTEMDGSAFVSQCPIPPGHSFTYKFPTSRVTGTHWYHSHYSTQYCDGLRGPLIIYDPEDPHRNLYDIDNESTIITFADWYHLFAPDVAKLNGPAIPDTILINGLGRNAQNTSGPLSVIHVEKGKRYRMRLINMSCDPNYFVTIEGHNLTIIEADGTATRPHTVDSLQFFAGQRYSVIVTADQPVGNYWIRANPSSGPQGFSSGINSAILRYNGAPEVEPSGINQTLGTTLQEQDLIPFDNAAPPGGGNAADVSFDFQATFNNGLFGINGVPYQSPSVPVLLQILNGVNPQNLLPKGSVYVLPRNKVIEISLHGGAPHPFHLHGHSFSVIRSAGQSGNNTVNPIRRDVVATGASTSDLTIIRFSTDNPGPWVFHCHIDWHFWKGLAIVFAEDPAGQVNGIDAIRPINGWNNLCPTWNSLPTGL